MDVLEQLPLSSLALLHAWVGNALEIILGNQTKQYDLYSSWKVWFAPRYEQKLNFV